MQRMIRVIQDYPQPQCTDGEVKNANFYLWRDFNIIGVSFHSFLDLRSKQKVCNFDLHIFAQNGDLEKKMRK